MVGDAQPYRISGRETASVAAPPRSAILALRFGTLAFATFAVFWLLSCALLAGLPSLPSSVSRLRVFVRELTLLSTLAVLAWRRLPTSRSHVPARIAIVGLVLDSASSHILSAHLTATFNSCGEIENTIMTWPDFGATALVGRLLVWGGLLLAVLAAGRARGTTSWPAVVGATIAVTVDPTLSWMVDHRLSPYSGTQSFACEALVYSLPFALFAYAFVLILRDLQRTPRIEETPVSLDIDEPHAEDLARADGWRATSLTLMFAVALSVSYAMESLTVLGGNEHTTLAHSSCASAILVALFVAVLARWRRRSTGASSAILVAAVLAALFAVVSAFVAHGVATSALSRCGSMLCSSVALVGFGMFLPSPAKAFERRMRAMTTQLLLGGILLGLAAIVVATKSHPAFHACLAIASAVSLTGAMAASRPLDHAAAMLDLAKQRARAATPSE